MTERWVGIDAGYSQMTIAVLDAGVNVVAIEHTREPLGDGHEKAAAIARLQSLLKRLSNFNHVPVRIAGYCYEHSEVLQAFKEAGWIVEGCEALNDVVGFYGLTEMKGNAIVGGCGSFSQVVYISPENDICWPGEDVVAELPDWLLSGWDYATFLLDLSKREEYGELAWLPKVVRETLGGETLESSGHRWSYLGPLLVRMLGQTEVKHFFAKAVENIVKTRSILGQYITVPEAPRLVLGGGAVREDSLWAVVSDELRKQGVIDVVRVQGEPAVGLVRFANYNPNVDAWSFIGLKRPSWL